MSRSAAWVWAAAALLVGVGIGYAFARAGAVAPTGAEDNADPSARTERGRPEAPGSRFDDDDGPRPRDRGASVDRPGRGAGDRVRRDRRRDRTRDPRSHDEAGPEDPATTGAEGGVERLRQEVEALRQERTELLGKPIGPPANVPPRFSGPTLNTAVGTALTTEGVAGEVEAVDCSEYPCIIFGRLEGDETDMEKVERSLALAEYRDDVLTMLFWATSVEDAEAAIAPETGLFALSFYSAEDQSTLGEELERRLRARVMEYWNTDRPGTRG